MTRPPSVLIIGAGFAGLGTAIRLLQSGIDDFVILERSDRVGGTWRDNTYPGAACDIPSVLYSYSFAPNPDWTRTYADGSEIQQYLVDCSHRFGLRPRIRFGTQVHHAAFDTTDDRWHLDVATPDGNATLTADICVLATGVLNEPAHPDVPGLESFAGHRFHSATWRHDVDLTGRTVAVVGTGASAIQFVPAIADSVGHLTVFQRTPPWIVPRSNPDIEPPRRDRYRKLGVLQRLQRARTFWTRELLAVAMTRRTAWLKRGEDLARRHLEDQVADPGLRAALTPDYALGCKRVLLSDDFYPALQRPHVDLVTTSIAKVVPDGIVTSDGVHHPADVLIEGTGFRVTDHPMHHNVVGTSGRSLAADWAERGMTAHLGTTVHGFPNLFLITGPNTGVGHTSMVFMMESQFAYILDALRALASGNVTRIEVRADAQAAFNDRLARRMDRTVWTTGGCASWYLDDHGRNTTLWPDTAWAYRRALRRFDATSYELVTG